MTSTRETAMNRDRLGVRPAASVHRFDLALRGLTTDVEINVYTDQPQAGPQLYAALHPSILDVFNSATAATASEPRAQ